MNNSFDVVVIGSGFGGSVSALRLREKGYSVAVLEAGRRFEDKDFPKTSWRLNKFLFAPKLGLYGIQRIHVLPDVLILCGAGVGGFAAIYNIFPDSWSWEVFWSITALLSIMLGVMNLLPIPALDGGHVMFLLYEMISGRKPSDKFLENAQMVGFFLLITLLLFANGNDIYKAIVGK